MKLPWSKFYWSDWRNDPRLRMVGLAARGLWIEMLALMHQAEPCGYLLVFGNAPTDEQLGALVGAPATQIPGLLDELERAGVFSRTRKGTIFSRRMLRDEKKRNDGRDSAKNGTLPTSRRGRQRVDKPGEIVTTPGVVEGVAAQPPPSQKPEAREEKGSEEADASSAVPAAGMLDLKRELWRRAKAILEAHGVGRDRAGQVIGRWRKTYSDPEIIDALAACEAEAATDPIGYIAACLERRKPDGRRHKTTRFEAALRAAERLDELQAGGDGADHARAFLPARRGAGSG